VRRVVAIVLPELACEIARQRKVASRHEEEEESRVLARAPLAVILEPAGAAPIDTPSTARLDVISEEARRFGIRPGQSVVEATALVAHLAIERVTYAELDVALGRVAEVALAFGATAAIELESSTGAKGRELGRAYFGEAPFDTVWLDATGAAHLVGGEDALLAELGERVASLGHRVRIAIAEGPRIAQALARWSTPGAGVARLADLPIRALPVGDDLAHFFLRVGVVVVSDLVRLPRASVTARLGERAPQVLALAEGRDDTPLVPYAPPRVLVEEVRFDEGTERVEPLLFVLRGMTSRLAARLGARGEAATRLELTAHYDASIARLRAEAEGVEARACLELAIDLPSPLAREADLLRPLKTKLEAATLLAPALGLSLTIPQIVKAPRIQLDLSRDVAVSPDALPALLAELSAEIGADRIGVLTAPDAHRPEGRSTLAPALEVGARRSAGTKSGSAGARAPSEDEELEPTRLLPEPIQIGRVREGAVLAIEQRLYAVERVRFLMRLDAVEWWTPSPVARDYARAWLVAGDRVKKAQGAPLPSSTAEALVFVNRATGEYFLQGFCE
jgi:protein ImuB